MTIEKWREIENERGIELANNHRPTKHPAKQAVVVVLTAMVDRGRQAGNGCCSEPSC